MPSLTEKLLTQGFRPHGNSIASQFLRKQGVMRSQEFERILHLPRRKLLIGKAPDGSDAPGIVYTVKYVDGTEVVKQVPDLSPVFRRPGGKMKLWPLQNAALWEAFHANGGFFPLATGGGKTLVSVLLCEAMNSQCTVILVKPELRDQLIRKDLPFYMRHWQIPIKRMHVVAYTELSSAKKQDILHKINPDLIVADEAHSLRARSSARTRRFLRFMKENPQTRFVALSGTMSKRSIMDFAHLMELALKKNAPIPHNFNILSEWAEALDVSNDPKPPGALLELCVEGESPRQGYRRRMVETSGVVASDESSVGTSLIIRERPLQMSPAVSAEVARLYETWQIGEEELADPMSLMRVARQLVCGFHYLWQWPNDVRDTEWLMARRAWHRKMRQYLQHHSTPGMDSPFLLAKAVQDGRWPDAWDEWQAWDAVRSRPEPLTVPKWISPFMIKDILLWVEERQKQKENGIVFYEHAAVGEALHKISKLPLYGAGADASQTSVQKEPIIICSIKAQGTGKNLQAWNRMLITTPPSNGLTFEQLIGRLHRPGQEADEVVIDVYMHCEEFRRAIENSKRDAQYLQDTQGTPQKLLIATWLSADVVKSTVASE